MLPLNTSIKNQNNNSNQKKTTTTAAATTRTAVTQVVIDELDGEMTLVMNATQRAVTTVERTNQNHGQGTAGLHRKKRSWIT